MTKAQALLAAAVFGVLLELAFAGLGGGPEAWDSPAYGVFGLPLGIIVCGILGFHAPTGAVWYGPLLMGSHFLTMVVINGGGPLLPLGLILAVVLSGPAVFASLAGAIVRRKSDSRRKPDDD